MCAEPEIIRSFSRARVGAVFGEQLRPTLSPATQRKHNDERWESMSVAARAPATNTGQANSPAYRRPPLVPAALSRTLPRGYRLTHPAGRNRIADDALVAHREFRRDRWRLAKRARILRMGGVGDTDSGD
jgi:hypothetical protein